jgi:hypothetical protein
MSTETRHLIADYLEGKKRRKPYRPSSLNIDLFYDYQELIQNHAQDKAIDLLLSKHPELNSLACGKEKKDSAAALKKHFQRMKPVMDEVKRINAEEYYSMMQEVEQRVKSDMESSMITEQPISIDEEQYIQATFNMMSDKEKEYWRQRFQKFGHK